MYIGRVWISTLLLVSLASCNSGQGNDPQQEAVRHNTTMVMNNLTEWAKANGGLYPEQLTSELLKDFQNEALLNPYSGSELIPVAFLRDPAVFGNICYIPVHEGMEVPNYILLGFGNTPEGWEDVDGDGTGDNVAAMITSTGLGKAEAVKYIHDMQ
jgi:hypothetical protein